MTVQQQILFKKALQQRYVCNIEERIASTLQLTNNAQEAANSELQSSAGVETHGRVSLRLRYSVIHYWQPPAHYSLVVRLKQFSLQYCKHIFAAKLF